MSDELRQDLRADREALIALVSAPEACEIPTEQLERGAPPLATLAQEALLPLAHTRRAEALYNVPLALEVDGAVDLAILHAALNAVQNRHDALRTHFPDTSDRPVFRPRAAGIAAEDTWFEAVEGAAADTAIRKAIARPFDLKHGPLWRYGIFSFRNERAVLLFVFHHLVFDGFSRDVFLADLASQYDAILTGGAASDAAPFQASDFAAWERRKSEGPRAEAARDWWRDRFTASCPSTALPVGPEAESARSRHVEISAGSAASLRARSASARLPVAAIVMTAAVLALHRMTGQRRILAMTPLANRDQPEAFGIIGYLNRVVPIVIALDRAATPAAIAVALARELFEANAHRFLPAAQIVTLPGLARSQLNRLLISFQERRRSDFHFGALPAREIAVERDGADFGLGLQFETDDGRLSCRIDRAAGVLGDDGQDAFATLLLSSIDAVAGDGWDRSVADVAPPLLDTSALCQVLAEHPAVDEAYAALDPETGVATAWIVLNEHRRVSDATLLDWLQGHLGSLIPPIRLVTRAALPRESNGAVDVEVLKHAGESSEFAMVEPPRSDLECMIAELWRGVLWLDRPIGRNEDFALLGGHSLLAVRMIADLEAALGRPFGHKAIAGLSTVAALAAALEAPDRAGLEDAGSLDPEILSRLCAYTSSWRGPRPFEGALIVGRNGDGTRPPLFWCLQSETELDQLARYIGEDQPVFGMRSGHAVMVKSRENIEQLALRYADDVMRTCPDGPLFFGGNCQAAVIAFHIAKHVQAAGREVALLILHEKMVPEFYAGRIALSFGRDSTRNPYRSSAHPHADFSPYYSGHFTIDLVSGAHGEFFREPNIQDLVAMIRRRRDEAPLLASYDAGTISEGGRDHVQHLE